MPFKQKLNKALEDTEDEFEDPPTLSFGDPTVWSDKIKAALIQRFGNDWESEVVPLTNDITNGTETNLNARPGITVFGVKSDIIGGDWFFFMGRDEDEVIHMIQTSYPNKPI